MPYVFYANEYVKPLLQRATTTEEEVTIKEIKEYLEDNGLDVNYDIDGDLSIQYQNSYGDYMLTAHGKLYSDPVSELHWISLNDAKPEDLEALIDYCKEN